MVFTYRSLGYPDGAAASAVSVSRPRAGPIVSAIVERTEIMKVTKEWLLLIAGVVWSIAGFNITRLGIMAYGEAVAPVLALAVGSVAVFTVFWTRVFSKMLHKHIVRIQGYGQEAQPFWRFFDTKSYIIMAIMMGGGISLRAFGLVPSWFIAFFYTGLGVALGGAGLGFLCACVREFRSASALAD